MCHSDQVFFRAVATHSYRSQRRINWLTPSVPRNGYICSRRGSCCHQTCSNSSINCSASNAVSSITRTHVRFMKRADLHTFRGDCGVAFQTSETKEALRGKLLNFVPPEFQTLNSTVGKQSLQGDDTENDDHCVKQEEEDITSWPVTAVLDLVASESHQLDPTHTYILRTKGHSRMNCNGTGVGILIRDADQDTDVRRARKHLLGDRSGSHAEYTALIMALKYTVSLGIRKVVIETNHELLHNQLSGNFPLIKESLQPFYWKVKSLLEFEFDATTISLVGFDQMKEALQLATTALATGRSFNMTNVVDPMGARFVGMGKQRNKNSLPPVTANDGEVAQIYADKQYLLQFDGGSRACNPSGTRVVTKTKASPFNPKDISAFASASLDRSGMGMVIFDDQHNEIWCGWHLLSPMSNNLAEYNALLGGLLCAYSLGIRNIKVEGDSELVIKQLKLQYNVRNPYLQIICRKTLHVLSLFDSFELHHIDRSQNKRADALANYAMDFESSYGFVESNNLQLWMQYDARI